MTTVQSDTSDTKVSMHPADRLAQAIQSVSSPVCVGIDPVAHRLPEQLRPAVGQSPAEVINAIKEFCTTFIHAVSHEVAAVKFQSACFERYRSSGVELLFSLMEEARQAGLVVILDAKRGDIGISAEHYAVAAFGEESENATSSPHWLTINGYLGADGILPFVSQTTGAFVLVRTSNPSGTDLQGLRLPSGETIAETLARQIALLGSQFTGDRGYSSIGAVVGATNPQEAEKLRAIMPEQIFLVPGYGAQGGGIDDVLPCFSANGQGALVAASRSVMYAFEGSSLGWPLAVTEAARQFADDVGKAVGLR